MFKFARKMEVLWPVRFNALRNDGSGQVDEVEIRIRYRIMTNDEKIVAAKKIEESAAAVKALDMGVINESRQWLYGHIVGWDGVVDADSGDVVPFSQANLAEIMNCVPNLYQAVNDGLWEASSGAPVKN